MKYILLIITLFFTTTVIAEDAYDPLEPINRPIFKFNESFDKLFSEPVAKGYKKVTPPYIHKGIDNFYKNLNYPATFVSSILQLKIGQALEQTSRFLINSTLGIGGLFDVANEFGIEYHYEDLGLALANSGVPAGPYIMLPLMGPTNVRDFIGRVGDTFLDPVYWIVESSDISDDSKFNINLGVNILRFIHLRSTLIEAIESGREASLDYYSFMQSSYYKYRDNLLLDGKVDSFKDEEDDVFGDNFGE